MNLPNRLTMARIALVPGFAVMAALANRKGSWFFYLGAGVIFALASLTDLLDGRIARQKNLVTDFGKFADPLADKILTTAALLYMMEAGVCGPVVLAIILAREFAVAGLRMVAASAEQGCVIPANKWGKAKTVLQMITINFFYFGMAIPAIQGVVHPVTEILCWVVAGVTLASGAVYLRTNRRYIREW